MSPPVFTWHWAAQYYSSSHLQPFLTSCTHFANLWPQRFIEVPSCWQKETKLFVCLTACNCTKQARTQRNPKEPKLVLPNSQVCFKCLGLDLKEKNMESKKSHEINKTGLYKFGCREENTKKDRKKERTSTKCHQESWIHDRQILASSRHENGPSWTSDPLCGTCHVLPWSCVCKSLWLSWL